PAVDTLKLPQPALVFSGQTMNQPRPPIEAEQSRAHTTKRDYVDPIVVRFLVIQHNYSGASRIQHPTHLIDRALSIRSVVKHSVRVNQIETIISKWQCFGVGHFEVRSQSLEFESLSHKID